MLDAITDKQVSHRHPIGDLHCLRDVPFALAADSDYFFNRLQHLELSADPGRLLVGRKLAQDRSDPESIQQDTHRRGRGVDCSLACAQKILHFAHVTLNNAGLRDR
jgi:hypothetical protein